jgi:hypothetical protein
VGDWITTVDTGKIAEVVAPLLALTTDTEDELKCRVIKGKWNSANLLRLGLEVVLRLDDKLLKMRATKLISLLLVKIDICDLHLRLEIVGRDAQTGARVADGNVRTRGDNKAFKTLELNIQLDTVVGERCKGESRPRREGEVEGKRDVKLTFFAGVTDKLRSCVTTARKLGQATTALASKLFPTEKEGTPKLVNLLTTDDKLGLVNEEVTRIVTIMTPSVTKLRADLIRAIGITLHAAR